METLLIFSKEPFYFSLSVVVTWHCLCMYFYLLILENLEEVQCMVAVFSVSGILFHLSRNSLLQVNKQTRVKWG